MIGKTLSREVLTEAWNLVSEAGNVQEAAERLGLSVSATTRRYRAACVILEKPDVRSTPRAIAALGGAKMSNIIQPKILNEKEPIEDWMQRRERAFVNKKLNADSREWMKFTITEPGAFGLVFVGDPHIDDDGCDLPKLRADIKTIEETAGLYGVGMGDWTNAWIGRLSRLYGQQGTTESDAWRAAEWLLSKPIWLLLLKGNHDLWHGAGSPLNWMATQAPMSDWQAKFKVASSCGHEWRIWAAHDFPGRSQWNKAHGPLKRAVMTGSEANLYISGHTHCFTLIEDQDEHTGKVLWAARCKGYKHIDSFGSQLGFGQSQDRGQSIVAICDPSTKRMRCFSDVQEGALFLNYLRQRKGRVKAGSQPL
jgi:hypothetical protein